MKHLLSMKRRSKTNRRKQKNNLWQPNNLKTATKLLSLMRKPSLPAESDQTSQEIPEKQYFSLTDLSIVISTQDEGLLPGGVTVDGVFYDDAALTTELGTLLISPSKVITARDIAID